MIIPYYKAGVGAASERTGSKPEINYVRTETSSPLGPRTRLPIPRDAAIEKTVEVLNRPATADSYTEQSSVAVLATQSGCSNAIVYLICGEVKMVYS